MHSGQAESGQSSANGQSAALSVDHQGETSLGMSPGLLSELSSGAMIGKAHLGRDMKDSSGLLQVVVPFVVKVLALTSKPISYRDCSSLDVLYRCGTKPLLFC